jgi:hypothetical protein
LVPALSGSSPNTGDLESCRSICAGGGAAFFLNFLGSFGDGAGDAGFCFIVSGLWARRNVAGGEAVTAAHLWTRSWSLIGAAGAWTVVSITVKAVRTRAPLINIIKNCCILFSPYTKRFLQNSFIKVFFERK